MVDDPPCDVAFTRCFGWAQIDSNMPPTELGDVTTVMSVMEMVTRTAKIESSVICCILIVLQILKYNGPSVEIHCKATPNLSSIRQLDQWKATAPWWWMYFQCIWLQVSRLVPMMALCSISEDKAAQEGNQLDKKSFDRDQNWWEDPLQSGSQPEGGSSMSLFEKCSDQVKGSGYHALNQK